MHRGGMESDGGDKEHKGVVGYGHHFIVVALHKDISHEIDLSGESLVSIDGVLRKIILSPSLTFGSSEP